MALEFEIPFVSFIFILILCIVYFSKKRLSLFENKAYSIILLVSLFVSILDTVLHIISATNSSDSITKFYPLVFTANKVISILFVIIFLSLLCYTLLISYKSIREKPKILLYSSIIIVVLFSVIVCFLKVQIVETTTARNVTGSAIILGYSVVAICLITSLLITLLNVKKKDKRYLAVFGTLMVIIFLYIVTIIFPGIIIYDLILALMCYIMFFTIENPDVKMVQQLNIAKNQAEQSNQAKTDFLSSMSHEIRTPLNAIVGFNQCIIDAKTLEEAKENSRDVLVASTVLLDIVNGILDISRIEAGKMEIVNSKYNVKEMFNDVIKLIEPRIASKNLEFKTQIASDLPEFLYGDLANLKKSILNLLTNAVKYTDSGSVFLSANQNNNCRLLVAIEDTGRGIKPENIEKLFTKFQRLEEDKNSTLEGTGLGLAITKQIIELMGGKVIVQSVFGSGSKFTIMVNQSIPNDNNEHNNIAINDEQNQPLIFENKKILVVDDNALNNKVAERLLKKYGIHVDCVNSGQECIDKINSEFKYDLIFMDDMMPKMSGIETLKILKETNNFNTPVIALTANAIVGMRGKYLSEGFNEYLAKPINRKELEQSLKKFLTVHKEKVDFINAVTYEIDYTKNE